MIYKISIQRWRQHTLIPNEPRVKMATKPRHITIQKQLVLLKIWSERWILCTFVHHAVSGEGQNTLIQTKHTIEIKENKLYFFLIIYWQAFNWCTLMWYLSHQSRGGRRLVLPVSIQLSWGAVVSRKSVKKIIDTKNALHLKLSHLWMRLSIRINLNLESLSFLFLSKCFLTATAFLINI